MRAFQPWEFAKVARETKRFTGIATAVICSAVLFSVLQAAAGTIDLKLRLTMDQSRSVRMTYGQTMYLGTGGARVRLTRSITAEYDFRVTAVDEEGNVTVAATFRSLALSIETPAGVMEYHSDNPSDEVDPSMPDGASLVGQDFHMIISPQGRIRDIQGMDRDIVNNIAMIYPDGPLNIGDSWVRKAPLSRAIPVLLDSVFTLADRKEGKIFVDVRSDINQSPGSGSLSLGPFRIGYDLLGDLKGTMQFEESTGVPLRADIHQELSAKLDIARNLDLFGDFSVPLKYEGAFLFETISSE